MRLSGVLFPFLVAASFVGAARGDEAEGLAKAIQPRSVGSVWEYSSYYFEGDQMVASGTTQERVLEELEIEGVTGYRVELLTDWRSFSERLLGVALDEDSYSYYWEYIGADGGYHFTEDFDSKAAPASLAEFALTLPYPVEVGARYVADGSNYEVIAVDREVEVPAGRFSTVVYQLENLDAEDPEFSDRQRLFMCPGVGLVRWEMDVYDENGSWVLDSRDDLFRFEIK